jgi:hypothetical protein
MRTIRPAAARVPLGLLLAAAFACGGRAATRPPADDAAAQDVPLEGRVRVAGHTPFEAVTLEPAGDAEREVELVGPLAKELRGAAGAQVAVWGARVAPRRVEVRRYEIREIAGAVPLVGTLEPRDGGAGLRVEGERRWLRLEAVPPELEARAGHKMWVILDADRRVRAFGILREGTP